MRKAAPPPWCAWPSAPDLGGGEGIDADFDPDLRLADGEGIEGDGWRVEASLLEKTAIELEASASLLESTEIFTREPL